MSKGSLSRACSTTLVSESHPHLALLHRRPSPVGTLRPPTTRQQLSSPSHSAEQLQNNTEKNIPRNRHSFRFGQERSTTIKRYQPTRARQQHRLENGVSTFYGGEVNRARLAASHTADERPLNNFRPLQGFLPYNKRSPVFAQISCTACKKTASGDDLPAPHI